MAANQFTQQQIDQWALAPQDQRLAAIKAYGEEVKDPTKFYEAAKQFGVTAADVDTAYGWTPGTSSQYITQNKMGEDLTGKVGTTGILSAERAQGRQDLIQAGVGSYDASGNFVVNPDVSGLNTLASTSSAKGIDAARAGDISNLNTGIMYSDGAKGVEWTIGPDGKFVRKTQAQPVDYGTGAVTASPGQSVMFPTVNPLTDTVEGRIQGILAADNPMTQMVRTRAAQEANKRGVVNTSMATQAGEAAVLQNAIQIATPDASTYSAQRLASQQEGNANWRQGQQLQSQEYIAKLNAQNQQLLAGLDSQTKVNMANIEANYKTLMQNNASAGELYQQAIKNITDISNNKDLTPEARAAAIANQVTLLKNGFTILGKFSNLNLGDLIIPAEVLTPNQPATPAPTPSPADNANAP